MVVMNIREKLKSGSIGVVIAGVAVLACAPASQAVTPSTVTITNGRLSYVAQPSRDDDVLATVSGSDLVLTDGGVTDVVLGGGTGACTDIAKSAVQDPGARCPLASIPAGLTIDVNSATDNVVVDQTVTLPTEIFGGVAKDALIGGSGDDTIHGDDANDTIDGRGGNDLLDGGDGKDALTGGNGDDTLMGGAETDTFTELQDGGTDWIDYSDHTDPVTVNPNGLAGNGTVKENEVVPAGIENLRGGSANDKLIGTQITNVLDGGPGADSIDGGRGPDTVDYSNRTCDLVVTVGTGGDDGCPGEGDSVEPSVENLLGGSGNDTLAGAAPALFPDPNVPPGNPVPDFGIGVISGGSGNDTLAGSCSEVTGNPDASDTFFGGIGTDTVTYGPIATCAGRTAAVNATIGGGAVSGARDNDALTPGDQTEGDQIMGDVENVAGGADDDKLSGDAHSNVLTGGPGSDSIEGGDAVDVLVGGTGADRLSGGDATDALVGDSGDDVLAGNDGNDVLAGGPDADTLDGGAGADVLSGGDGSDRVDYGSRLTPVLAALDGTANDGEQDEGDNIGADVETVSGGASDDLFIGDAGDNTFDGGPGDDQFDGGPGADNFTGGAGRDLASYEGRPAGVTVSLNGAPDDGQADEHDNIDADVVVGTDLADQLSGSDAADTLDGAGGDDRIAGNGGDDGLDGGPGNDTLDGGAGNDSMHGDDGNDTLSGGDDSDVLDGDSGDDSLTPGGGIGDLISGGSGIDVASYGERSAAVALSLNGAPDDGEVGEGDNVGADVEALVTGAGADAIDSRDGRPTRVTCGGGDDDALIDSGDSTASDCESVSTVRISTAKIASLASRSVRVSKSGRVKLRVACPAGGDRCDGSLFVDGVGGKRKPKLKGALGSAAYGVTAGSAADVDVQLSSKARSVLKRSSKITVRVRLLADGAALDTAKRSQLTIKAAKRKRGKR